MEQDRAPDDLAHRAFLQARPRVAFVLAAGKSRRMGMLHSKIMMDFGGRAMIYAVLGVALHWAQCAYLVLSPQGAEQWASSSFPLKDRVHVVIQGEARGTGHAVAVAWDAALARDPELSEKEILILLGDAPLIQAQTLTHLFRDSLTMTRPMALITMKPPFDSSFGQIEFHQPLRDLLSGAISDSDAAPSETGEDKSPKMGFDSKEGRGGSLKSIFSGPCSIIECPQNMQTQACVVCNTGVMNIMGAFLGQNIHRLPLRQHQQLYITDLLECAPAVHVFLGPWEDFLGINTPANYTLALSILQGRLRAQALQAGALLMAPETVFLSWDTVFGAGCIIEPYVTLAAGVTIDAHAHIKSFSSLGGCHIQAHAKVGPFAHIRPGTTLEPFSYVGSFVELKETHMGTHSQAKHLSYLGNATLGPDVNIGAGVITCNYDGHKKSCLSLGAGVFVGSNSALVAPLVIGENATIGAGSVITRSVDPHALAFTRVRQNALALPPHHKHCRRARRSKPADVS